MNASSAWTLSYNSDGNAAISLDNSFIGESSTFPKILQDNYLKFYFYFLIMSLPYTYWSGIEEQILAR